MLELRKGKSTKSYENDFFRLLASGLITEFDKRGWNGLLMGMPESLAFEGLQIDCLLITNDQIILIDFKNYSGDLELPEAESFAYGFWLINGEVAVRGGSSINPYKQLGKQRAKLAKVLEKTMRDFDKKTVFTLVCFHGQININGEVPRHIIGFDVVDSTTVFNKIVDIIDVENGNHQYLKPATKTLFTEKLFSAPEYELSITYEAEEAFYTEDASKITDDVLQSFAEVCSADAAAEGTYDSTIQDFLKSKDRVLIVSGNTKSGKTGLIPRIRDLAFDLGFTEVPVFAYSSRLRQKMLKNYPELEEVDSLFGEVFDFGNASVDENYKKTIPVKVLRQTEEESHQEEELYIIDDSQLISNSNSGSEILQFGTGCLLDDLFSYLQLNKYPERKVVFLGDVNRISYGSKVENVMHADYLSCYLENKDISTEIRRLALPPRTSGSEIIKVCNKIAEDIAEEKYNELVIANTNEVSVGGTENEIAILKATFNDPILNKILVYTNKQANQINLWIKKQLAKNGSRIGAGDAIVFNSPIEAYAPQCIFNEDTPFGGNDQPFNFDEPKRIDNGSFATVISVEFEGIINKASTIKGEAISLTFIPCQVRLHDSSTLQMYVFDNYLRADKSELTTSENMAYQVILSALLQDFMSNYAFEDSDEFKEMEKKNDASKANTGKPYYYLNDKGEYRLKEDGRSLPPEVKQFRKRIEKKLLTDSSTDYFKIYNAARIKYAWAMTVNRAMAYSFDSVFFDTKQGENHGRTNKDYFKWLYTGFAAAESKIELINWKPISPFMNTNFNPVSHGPAPKTKHNILTFSNNDKTKEAEFENFIAGCLAGTGWKLVDILPRPYLEIVKLQKGESTLELFFDYNGKGEVKAPRLKSGSNEDLEEVVEIIESAPNDAGEIKVTEEYKKMGNCFDVLLGLLKSRNIKTEIKSAQKWNVIFELTTSSEKVEVQCWYDSCGMVSKFNLISGSTALFNAIIEIIEETYSIKRTSSKESTKVEVAAEVQERHDDNRKNEEKPVDKPDPISYTSAVEWKLEEYDDLPLLMQVTEPRLSLVDEIGANEAIAYVDGSYREDARGPVVGSGIYITVLINEIRYAKEISYGFKVDEPGSRNVTGETQAAMIAVEWAIRHGVNDLIIRYDYIGVAAWAEGSWKAKNDKTKAYAAFMKSAMRHLNIHFEKVNAHSGDAGNDKADRLAGNPEKMVDARGIWKENRIG